MLLREKWQIPGPKPKDSGSVNLGVREAQRPNFNRNREENIVSFLHRALLENGRLHGGFQSFLRGLMHQTEPTNHQQAIN